MPFKDKDAQLKYQREWYRKHRERVVGKVAKRKRTLYAGTCKNCGGPTVGQTKGKAPDYCRKPLCLRAQRLANRDVFVDAARRGKSVTKAKRRRELDKQQAVSIDDVIPTL